MKLKPRLRPPPTLVLVLVSVTVVATVVAAVTVTAMWMAARPRVVMTAAWPRQQTTTTCASHVPTR